MRGNMTSVTVLLGALVLAASVLAEKPPKAQQSNEGPAARLSEAPESARQLENPFKDDHKAVAAGRKLFLRHCSECHSKEGYGIGRAANLHSAAILAAPPGVLFWSIRNGRLPKGMPAWSSLPDQQIWQLVTYLKTLH